MFSLIFIYTVVLTSNVAGFAAGLLLCSRHRRAGTVTLAATCTATAVIVVADAITGGSTTGHALGMAARFAILPAFGAAFACIMIAIGWVLWATGRRVFMSIWRFGSNVFADALHILRRPTSPEHKSRPLSKASRLSLGFIALAAITIFGLNIGAIADFATRISPRMPVVTNLLDLVALILATPKVVSTETRDNVRNLSIQTLELFTLNKIRIPHNAIAYISGAAIFLSMIVLIPMALTYMMDYEQSQLVELNETLNRMFPDPVLGYITRHVVEPRNVSNKMWSFTFQLLIVYVVLVASVMLLSSFANASSEAQKRIADKLLLWGLAVFAYSRALSMME